jgi:hypothetical protein
MHVHWTQSRVQLATTRYNHNVLYSIIVINCRSLGVDGKAELSAYLRRPLRFVTDNVALSRCEIYSNGVVILR